MGAFIEREIERKRMGRDGTWRFNKRRKILTLMNKGGDRET